MPVSVPAAAPDATAEVLAGLQALGDGNRLRILSLLRVGEQCVCRLTDALEMAQPLLSHHLRVLREAGLVRDRREGRWVYYSLAPDGLDDVGAFLQGLQGDARARGRTFDRCR